MKTTVTKFGGSSLADANQIKKVMNIVRSNESRRFVVVSAPGKRNSEDVKITDVLYQLYDSASQGYSCEAYYHALESRYLEIITGLGIDFDLQSELAEIKKNIETKPNRDYLASRGEYLNAKIISAALGFPFIDPKDYILFDDSGNFDADRTNAKLAAKLLSMDCAVIAGFYGADKDGNVVTFSRGGSDITGSIVARAVQADLYENWTDVSGLLRADPRIVDSPEVIDYISYSELRELTYMGFSVFHEDAVFPVRRAGIPINIRNTNAPEDPGTMIVSSLPKILPHRVLTGIAGKKGFTAIQIEKTMMNSEIGFGMRLLQIIAKYGVSFEHCPTGIDTISLIVNAADFDNHRDSIIKEINDELQPDAMYIEENLALIAVVGHGMAFSKGVAAKIFGAVADADVNIRMIDQGSSELNIILAVSEADYAKAIQGIYEALVGGKKE